MTKRHLSRVYHMYRLLPLSAHTRARMRVIPKYLIQSVTRYKPKGAQANPHDSAETNLDLVPMPLFASGGLTADGLFLSLSEKIWGVADV